MQPAARLTVSQEDWHMIIIALRKAAGDVRKDALALPTHEASKARQLAEWWVNLAARLETALPKQGKILLPPGAVVNNSGAPN